MNVGFGYEASTNGAGAEQGPPGQADEATPMSRGLELARTRPELIVGAAFAGGLIAAFLLRRLGH